ncbi:helix-turn-helix transcriptional regulator [Fibrobacter sp. UBA3718]|uniref:helix-turn-helix domain-containing protein n=1 Tax=Fibrobacter sp. UBA3718 TaxID=1946531 RepID=UPI0025B802C5|nr:helix-turn-helix transcriptional regulator [Fibrobacter sp. UBA3718]
MSMSPIEDKRPDERLGSYLARAREAKGLSVEELATVTKLTVKNITLIESGDWKAFPVEAYLRGYLHSICVKLNLDSKRVLDYYSGETGAKFSSLLSPSPAKPAKPAAPVDEEHKPHSKAVPVVVVLLGLAFVVGTHFMKNMDEGTTPPEMNESAAEMVVEPPAPSEMPSEMPEGAEAIAPDSSSVDSAAVDSSSLKVTQEVVDEAVKKSDLPASATIFISSTSGKDAPAEKTNKTRIELVASGEMRSWIGLKRHEEDNAFLKEANLAEKGTRLIYESEDTLFVVVGEPRAISKMLLNGKESPLPEMKFGRVARFRVFGGEIVKTKGGR